VPRFFFDLHDDMNVEDEEGIELSSPSAAREWAIKNARDMACAEVLGGRLNLRHFIEVRDESGVSIARIRFGDAVDVER
jgi:hypothetical protein